MKRVLSYHPGQKRGLPKCQGTMRIISFIEDREVIKAILKHLGLWLAKSKPAPRRMPHRLGTRTVRASQIRPG